MKQTPLEVHDYYIEKLAPGVKKVKLLLLQENNTTLVVDNVKVGDNILPLYLTTFPNGRIDPLSSLGKLLTFLKCVELSELPGKEVTIDEFNKKLYITGLN